MMGCTGSGKPVKRGGLWGAWALLAGMAVLVAAFNGCTPGFYRKGADKEVSHILKEKDKYPAWRIANFHVYPDARARFADNTKPDKPPMPPDDPAARDLSPNPQHPPLKGGVAKVEGDGYVQLLAAWDRVNRALAASRKENDEKRTDPSFPEGDSQITRASLTLEPEKDGDGPRLPDPESPDGQKTPKQADANPSTRAYGTGGGTAENGQAEGVFRPFLVNEDQVVELGLINSREFQSRREDLYLAALPVKLQRFTFTAQPFLVGQTIRERVGSEHPDGPGNRWRFNTDAGFSKLFSTGALLLFQFANRTIVNLTEPAPRHTISVSTINLDFVQPLLQGAGKAVTLEPLTQVERNLLYEIRDYARFRKIFYVGVVGGADAPFAIVPTAFGGPSVSVRLPGQVSAANAALVLPGSFGGTDVSALGVTAPIEGYLPNLLRNAQLENERANVAALERILARYNDFAESGDFSQLQVDQVEQQLLTGRSTVLQRELDYRDGIDRFKIQLGLPTNLPIELDDGPLRPLMEHLRKYEDVIAQADTARREAQKLDDPAKVKDVRPTLLKLFTESDIVRGTKFRTTIAQRWKYWENLSRQENLSAIRGKVGGDPTVLQAPVQTLPYQLLDPKGPLLTRLTELREERRKILDLKIEYEKKDQTLPPKDQQRLNQIELDLDLGFFEAALTVYEQELWVPTDAEMRAEQLRETQRQQMLAQAAAEVLTAAAEPGVAAGLATIEAVRRFRSLQAQVREERAAVERTRYRVRVGLFRSVIDGFALVMVEARTERLEQIRNTWPELPRLCLDGVDLLDAELPEALDLVGRAALTNRLDLMNARGQLVDAWRSIAVLANSLLGVFDVQYHLDSSTPPGENRPFQFAGDRTRHQLILNYEFPLVRQVECNNYRAGLIRYQRQRRALMSFEDQVLSDVRSEIRQLRVLAENYKIQQRQVDLAYSQVEQALDVVDQPQAPTQGGAAAGNAGNAAALTQQLLNAQRSLPTAQNQLYTVWIQYLTFRLQLYRDLELMPLDDRGVWTDDVATCQCPGAKPKPDSKLPPGDDPPKEPGSESLPQPRPLPEKLP